MTLAGLLVGVASVLILGQSLVGAAPSDAWSGLGLALALTLPGYVLGKLGAGDVKLLMAMGMLTDWHTLLLTFVVGSAVGLALGLWPLARHWLQDTLSVTLGRAAWMSTQAAHTGRHIPYGTALAAGFVFALSPAMSKL